MIIYNILYDKEIPIETVRKQLEFSGVVINVVFEKLHAMNISSDTLDFTNLTSVVKWEEDIRVFFTCSFEWHHTKITSSEIYVPENNGDGVFIYLVDSGVDVSHPEFSNANIVNVYSYDGTFTDDTGHGTGLASLIVGNSIGVSTKAVLKVIKIETGNTTIGKLLDAFNTIVIDNTAPVSVINCSWLIRKTEIFDTILLELQSAGFIVVAAGGNRMLNANDYSPVSIITALGVGACDAYNQVIPWSNVRGSNWGSEINITAPGIDVAVAHTPSGDILTGSGTSLATAIVSAVTAQYIVRYSAYTAEKIQNTIINSGKKDVLIRDEIMYSTTPNLLIQIK